MPDRVFTALTLVQGTADGYSTLGVGDSRGSTRDYVLLDTPLGRALGAFFLEATAVLFGIVVVAPKYALRPRILVPSIAVVMRASILTGVLFG